jgi:hypothetical protein
MRRVRRTLAALLLLATALAGGPGLAGLEAWEHAHRNGPGHGHRIHFEQRGGADHDDACRAWRASAPARAPVALGATLKLPDPVFAAPCAAIAASNSKDPTLLPHSRAPPVPA